MFALRLVPVRFPNTVNVTPMDPAPADTGEIVIHDGRPETYCHESPTAVIVGVDDPPARGAEYDGNENDNDNVHGVWS